MGGRGQSGVVKGPLTLIRILYKDSGTLKTPRHHPKPDPHGAIHIAQGSPGSTHIFFLPP